MKKKKEVEVPEILDHVTDVVLKYRPKDKQHKPPKKKKKQSAKTRNKS